MKRQRSIEEINEKILNGSAVVLTASEISALSGNHSPEDIFDAVDVVTTGTFSPMCSSGAFLNFGHTSPPTKMKEVRLNGVEAYAGLAAVDAYLGAAQSSDQDPAYGGAHVIEALIKGENVLLEASGSVTDCYPSPSDKRPISLNTINEAYLYNPRNCYQNYAAAVNSSHKTLRTYMGTLLPGSLNINYCTSGELSPLMNDPDLRTIGTGTRILLCGGPGYVSARGTQFNPGRKKNRYGIPVEGAATLALSGNMRSMNPRYVKGVTMPGYGVTIFISVSIPVPLLDTDLAARVMITNDHIDMAVRDFADPDHGEIALVRFSDLVTGAVEINGKKSRTVPLSSFAIAQESAELLKSLIQKGSFLLTAPAESYDTASREEPVSGRSSLPCALCGACVALCPEGALTLENSEIHLDDKRCSGCLLCREVCPCGLARGGTHG